MRADVYFSLDVEADGPIPGPYSMVSLGAGGRRSLRRGVRSAADPTADTFYRELRPISDDFVPEALAVSGLDRAALLRDGADPAAAMGELSAWVTRAAGDGGRSSSPTRPCYDWMFLYWYLLRFTGPSVFGHSGCLDIKTLYAVQRRRPDRRGREAPACRAHLLSRRPAHPPRPGRRRSSRRSSSPT